MHRKESEKSVKYSDLSEICPWLKNKKSHKTACIKKNKRLCGKCEKEVSSVQEQKRFICRKAGGQNALVEVEGVGVQGNAGAGA